ncbi:MAG: Gfo/Idh/MocA family oxidoreductase [bacterium]|nr:Gfo/Idh/MocA family oxidoreductase [bacterium]
MSTKSRVSRRRFLKQTAVAGAAAVTGPLILPACARGKAGRVSPNDKVRVGYIAVGRRARQLMGLPGDAEIVAISDVNKPRMDHVAGDKPWKKYQDYQDLLADDSIDAVVVASPDHWHTLHSVHACEAGKDVYCEKPMTLTIAEGRALVNAVRKNERVFQTGSQQRSSEKSRIGCQLVRSGCLGKISVIHTGDFESPWDCDLPAAEVPDGLDWDAWCGQTEPRPYHPELYAPRVRGHEAGWISFTPYSGGEMTGWGAHGFDMIQWAMGMDESGPVEVWPVPGTEKKDGIHKGPSSEVNMRYANGTIIKLDAKGPRGGGVFEGENGRILIDRGKYAIDPAELGEEALKNPKIELQKSKHHLGNWIDCIRSRERCIADVEIGHRSATVCHLGNIARWVNRKLQWDPKKEQFVNDDEANSYVSRPMRKPYSL